MRLFFLSILVIFNSCTSEDTSYSNRSVAIVTDADRIKKLELTVALLVTQITTLKKNDSIYNARITSGEVKFKDLSYRNSSDSILVWRAIKTVTPLVSRFSKDSLKQWQAITSALTSIPKLSSLTSRYVADSVKQWNVIKTLTPLIQKVASLKVDSINQWVAIKILQSASPVTQIPIIQAQIKTIQSKDLAQDKNIVANLSLIISLGDSVKVLKVYVGDDTDITLDSNGRVIISKLGMDRIRSEMKQ